MRRGRRDDFRTVEHNWSSSPNHTMHCLSSDCQHPLPYGQSSAMPADARYVSAAMSLNMTCFLTCVDRADVAPMASEGTRTPHELGVLLRRN